MKKEQLLQLLDLKFLETNIPVELEKVLNLTNQQVECILKYSKLINENLEQDDMSEIMYNYILCLPARYYDFVFGLTSQIKNLKTAKIFCSLATDTNLLNSIHYYFVLNLASKIEDPNILEQFYYIAYDEVLLNSEYYEFVLELASKIDSDKLLDSFGYVVLDDDLLEINNYKFVVNTAFKIQNEEILKDFCFVARDTNLLVSRYYEFALTLLSKSKSKEQFDQLKVIACSDLLKTDYYELALSIASKIEDIPTLKLYENALGRIQELDPVQNKLLLELIDKKSNTDYINLILAVGLNKDFINSDYYVQTLDIMSEIDNITKLKCFNKLARNNQLLKSNNYMFAIKFCKNVKNIELLQSLSDIMNDSYFINSDNYKETIMLIHNIEDKKIKDCVIKICQYSYLANKPNFLEILYRLTYFKKIGIVASFESFMEIIDFKIYNLKDDKRFETMLDNILEILYIENYDVALDILQEYKDVLYDIIRTRDNPTEAFFNYNFDLKYIIQRYEFANVLLNAGIDNIKNIIEQLPDDSEITPKTLVKIK